MSRKKASNLRRTDNEFDRSGNSRDVDSVSNKQLFDPRSDNPIKFNKTNTRQQETSSSETKRNLSRQSVSNSSSPRREESPFNRREEARETARRSDFSRNTPPPLRGDDYNREFSREDDPRRAAATSGRRLWTPDDGQRASPSRQKGMESPPVKIMSSSNNPKQIKIIHHKTIQLKPKETEQPETIDSSEKEDGFREQSTDNDFEEQQSQDMSSQEQTSQDSNKEAQLKETTRTEKGPSPPKKSDTLSEEDKQQEAHRKKLKSLVSSIRQIEGKLETLAKQARSLPCFNDNDTEIHQDRQNAKSSNLVDSITAEDIQKTDEVWKEKIQLHLALGEVYLQVMQCDLAYAEKKGLETLCWKRAVYSLVDQFRHSLKRSADKLNTAQTKLAAQLFEEEEDSEESEQTVPVIHEGGGMTFVKVEPPAKKEELHVRQTKMILSNFLSYLDLADDFYLKLTRFLKSMDGDDTDSDIETCLAQWRRVQRYKWYSAVSLRGDIARYRWVYTTDDDSWTKAEAFEEVWKRYFLGIWLMPAKGNLYFNLSLLLQQPHNTQGLEFHKLYYSTRSLMVRRNGFLNARESMLALFEGNRRWIHKYVLQGDSKKQKSSKKSTTPKKFLRDKKDATIPALFVRLHGMLFTKIGLDEFAHMRRIFFDILFEKKSPNENHQVNAKDDRQLSSTHLFWIETVIMCLSSLYSYNFATSQLYKLTDLNTKRLFYDEDNDHFKQLSDEMNENILFTHGIDLTCQVAVELFQRYLDSSIPQPVVPHITELPHVSLNYVENKEFLFGDRVHPAPSSTTNSPSDELAWLIYIEILLHWIILNGICIRSKEKLSLWELIIGDIGYDLIAHQNNQVVEDASKVSPSFWPLLLKMLNKLLLELPHEDKYDMVNKHLMDDDDEETTPSNISESELAFAKNVLSILGERPELPEENYLRGLGWVDDIHGRFLKLNPAIKKEAKKEERDMVTCRKMKILEYGFTLVKHLEDVLYYDPVEEMFSISKTVEDRVNELEQKKQLVKELVESEDDGEEETEEEETDDVIMTSIAEMDDDVLLSSETEIDELNEGDDIMTQLKKRREQLQSIVATAEAEERFGYRRLPNRVKEREARLNYLRERIIPGKTILVLDTNCFIGHIDYVRKLFNAQKWSIIVPLVVVTELDGLKTNTHRLGRVAQEGIQLLETTLANKPKQSTSLRIQTSHNNFMNDISIRSEQFVFGETDKNLDDLILSTCLWWISQQSTKDTEDKTVPVCLVTGDRNLSVKARARDVEVVPVSAVIQLTPK